MNVSEAIRTKRAVRKFQDRPLPEEVLYAILSAGRRSQSSKNEQAWQFIAIRDRYILKALSDGRPARLAADIDDVGTGLCQAQAVRDGCSLLKILPSIRK